MSRLIARGGQAVYGIVQRCVDKARDFSSPMRARVSDSKSQRRLILTIVCVALLLDNMLYMVIVPIITEYFKKTSSISTTAATYDGSDKPPNPSFPIPTMAEYEVNLTGSGVAGQEKESIFERNFSHSTKVYFDNGDVSAAPSRRKRFAPPPQQDANEDTLTGILFASKAIVQLMANIFTGSFIDRVGYVMPLTMGLFVMFFSTAIFACASTFGLLFVARSLQGVGSALADTACLGMIADRFHDEAERSKALGLALSFISFGSLVAPPFGGVLSEFAGRECPFLILAFVCLLDAMLLLLVQIPAEDEEKAKDGNIPVGTPMYKLFMDPYIGIIAASLMISNFPLAFLEPTIAKWMEDTMGADKWQIGLVWLPAFFPYLLGVFVTVKLSVKYFRYQWLCSAIGLVFIGVFTALIPSCKSYVVLMVPLALMCFGIALIDTALLPTLAFIVDVRHTSVYGSVYAIADMSYSIAYALGPVLAGQAVQALGYKKMNIGIGIANMMFAPLLLFLREAYDWKPDKSERITLLDPDGNPVHPSFTFERSVSRPESVGSSEGASSSTPSNGHPVPAKTPASTESITRTSIAPRPRPRATKKQSVTELESNGQYATTVLAADPAAMGKYGNRSSSTNRPISPSSISKGDFTSLAETGVEVRNPLFDL